LFAVGDGSAMPKAMSGKPIMPCSEPFEIEIRHFKESVTIKS
jgi:hypothetical protein